MKTVEVKLEWNVNTVSEKIGAQENVWWILGTQPEKLSEGELININEESECNEKNSLSQRKWHWPKQKKHIKGTLRDNTALKAQRLTCW